MPLRHQVTKTKTTLRHLCRSETGLKNSPSRLSHTNAFLGVVDHPVQRRREFGRTAGGNQQACLAIRDNLGHCSGLAADNRLSDAHCLEKDQTKRFEAAWSEQDV